MSKIESLLEELKEQTGLEISFRLASYADRERGEIFTEDEERTCFLFTMQTETYVGSIYGSSIAEYNYAVLCKKLLESTIEEVRLSKSEYLSAILTGKKPASEMKQYIERYAVPVGACYAVCVQVDKNEKETAEVLQQALSLSGDYLLKMQEGFLLIKYENEEEYRSTIDFANFLAQSIFEEIGVHPVIGVGGTVNSFYAIADSFRQAALAVRMSKTFHSKGEVHTYKEFLLVKMLEEIPIMKRKEYMSEFLSEGTREILEDKDMTDTVEEFFLNSLNLSETARKLFMHRNTLTYRLDKIERMTGLDVRRFSDAISFQVLTLLYRLQQEGKNE